MRMAQSPFSVSLTSEDDGRRLGDDIAYRIERSILLNADCDGCFKHSEATRISSVALMTCCRDYRRYICNDGYHRHSALHNAGRTFRHAMRRLFQRRRGALPTMAAISSTGVR